MINVEWLRLFLTKQRYSYLTVTEISSVLYKKQQNTLRYQGIVFCTSFSREGRKNHTMQERKVRNSRPNMNGWRSEEHTSELQSLMRISYAVFCLNKKQNNTKKNNTNTITNT